MCHLVLYEHYTQCGCILNVGFKYKPEWCLAPNGIPFPNPDLFNAEPGRIPSRCCDEERWTYGQADISGVCLDCKQKLSLRRNGLGEIMKRMELRCGHTKDWFFRARIHCAFRFDEKVLPEDGDGNVNDVNVKDVNNTTNPNINDDEEKGKTTTHLNMPPCWYTYKPYSRQVYNPATEADLEQWHRIKAGWTLDFNLLRGQGKVRYFVLRHRPCGNCERKANLELYDLLMMGPDEDRSGYRKRKPYALDISVEKARKWSAG
ncbi:hypothetical protein DTO271D3_9041 [Paecilomyces variotii]|nr:hypothetical protein DTO271D3_9041 [Paecilomyces variotii]